MFLLKEQEIITVEQTTYWYTASCRRRR